MTAETVNKFGVNKFRGNWMKSKILQAMCSAISEKVLSKIQNSLSMLKIRLNTILDIRLPRLRRKSGANSSHKLKTKHLGWHFSLYNETSVYSKNSNIGYLMVPGATLSLRTDPEFLIGRPMQSREKLATPTPHVFWLLVNILTRDD